MVSMSKTVTVLAAKFSGFTVFDIAGNGVRKWQELSRAIALFCHSWSSDDLSPRVVLHRDSERRTET